MKKHITYFTFLLGIIMYGQTSKTIFNELGITVNYNLSVIGSTENPETGTKFNRYKIIVTIQNNSAKYWEYSSCSVKAESIPSKVLSSDSSDYKFYYNNRLEWIDHFCIEDNCTDFPRYNSVAAPHQVICPNGTQKCEKEFLYPTSIAGEPNISWWGWIFKEMISEVKQNTAKSTVSTNTPIKSTKTNTLVNETKLFDKSKSANIAVDELISKLDKEGFKLIEDYGWQDARKEIKFQQFELRCIADQNKNGGFYISQFYFLFKTRTICEQISKLFNYNINDNYTKEVNCIDADLNDIHSWGAIYLKMK